MRHGLVVAGKLVTEVARVLDVSDRSVTGLDAQPPLTWTTPDAGTAAAPSRVTRYESS